MKIKPLKYLAGIGALMSVGIMGCEENSNGEWTLRKRAQPKKQSLTEMPVTLPSIQRV